MPQAPLRVRLSFVPFVPFVSFVSFVALAAVAVAMSVALGAQAARSDADIKELEQYRLTTEMLHKMELVAISVAKNMETDPQMIKWRDARREAETLEQKNDLTAADQKRLEQLAAIVALKPYEADRLAETLSEMAAAYDKMPPIASALQAQGVTSREFAKFVSAMALSAMVQGAQQAAGVAGAVPGVNAENVKFVSDHAADIERIGQLFEQASQ